MSKVREKDSGRFMEQIRIPEHPAVDKLDLSKEPKKQISQNFQRGALGPDQGRARTNAKIRDQGPTIPS
jgi:hypothetical protein